MPSSGKSFFSKTLYPQKQDQTNFEQTFTSTKKDEFFQKAFARNK